MHAPSVLSKYYHIHINSVKITYDDMIGCYINMDIQWMSLFISITWLYIYIYQVVSRFSPNKFIPKKCMICKSSCLKPVTGQSKIPHIPPLKYRSLKGATIYTDLRESLKIC